MDQPPDPTHEPFVPMARPLWTDVHQARPIGELPVGGVSSVSAHEISLSTASRGSVWLDLLVLLVALILFEIAASTVVWVCAGGPSIFDDALDDSIVSAIEKSILIPTLALRAFGAVAIITLIVRLRGQGRRSVGVSSRHVGLDLLIGNGTAAVAFGCIFTTMIAIQILWPDLTKQMDQNIEHIYQLVPHLSPLGFAGLALTISVYEELIFRGFVMTRLRRGTGSWTLAVILSTIFFVGPHAIDQEPIALVGVTILSILFGLVTIWRRSIIPAVVAHAIWDFGQFIALHVTAGDAWK